MHKRNAEQKDHYFRELAHNLRQEGFTVCPEEDWLLPVEMEGQPLCRATDSGGVRYWKEDADSESRCNAIERVTDIVRITDEYMSQMDAAPDLKVGNLSENYKLLAEFNGTVLAGHLTKYGAQFITWSRGYEQTSLQHGHYYGPDSGVGGYTAAKQDFATRSGLIPDSALFSTEQMAGVYRCVQDALDNGCALTSQQEDLLQEVCEKIRQTVPDLEEQLTKMEPQQPGLEQEQQML